MKIKLIAVLTSILLSSLAAADGLIGIGSFNSDEAIDDPQIRGNIASIYYAGVGTYQVSFTAELSGNVDDYVAIPTGWQSLLRVCDVDRQSKTLYGFTITCKDAAGNYADPKNVQFTVLSIEAE